MSPDLIAAPIFSPPPSDPGADFVIRVDRTRVLHLCAAMLSWPSEAKLAKAVTHLSAATRVAALRLMASSGWSEGWMREFVREGFAHGLVNGSDRTPASEVTALLATEAGEVWAEQAAFTVVEVTPTRVLSLVRSAQNNSSERGQAEAVAHLAMAAGNCGADLRCMFEWSTAKVWGLAGVGFALGGSIAEEPPRRAKARSKASRRLFRP